MNASMSHKSFALVASLFVAMMTGCAAGTDTDGEQEGTQDIAQASAPATADEDTKAAHKDPRSLKDRGVRQDPRSLNDRGPGVDPRNDVQLDVPPYKGAETAQVIDAVTAPAQLGIKGTVHLGPEAACSLKNGKWNPELERCLTAAEFAAEEISERF
jgi:hypothetical protein